MILAFDTSSAACTTALFDEAGTCIAHRDALIGRGHSEGLVPMIADLLGGRAPRRILVGVGPGSFTGIRVAVAAAHGLAIGWGAELSGMSTLALIAAGAPAEGEIAVALTGGHGELFLQQFDAMTATPTTDLHSLVPASAAEVATAPLVIGTGAQQLVGARGWGEAREGWPAAANALRLPEAMRSLPSKPIYARAPDAKAKEAA